MVCAATGSLVSLIALGDLCRDEKRDHPMHQPLRFVKHAGRRLLWTRYMRRCRSHHRSQIRRGRVRRVEIAVMAQTRAANPQV